MHFVVLQTDQGRHVASLLFATVQKPPATSPFLRDCVFMASPGVAEAMLAGTPTELTCRIDRGPETVHIETANPEGWEIRIDIGRNSEGTWTALRDGERLHGRALVP